jgi:hypothetical protein
LLWTGGIATVALSSAGLVRILESPGAAYSPWLLWNDPSLRGTPLALAAAGILAASPHNTQPWLFKVGEQSIEVWADLSRDLGAMDPFLREMHIGLGCAIENMVLAAPANGYAVNVEALPASLTALDRKEPALHAATLYLTKLPAPGRTSELYPAIPLRRTSRYAYDRSQALPPAWHKAIKEIFDGEAIRIFLFEDGPKRVAYDAMMVEATEAIIADAAMIGDSDRWFRGSASEIGKHRSGPSLDTAGLSPLALTAAKILLPILPASTNHDAWLAQTRGTQLATAPIVGIIAVKARYDRPASLTAGRAWQRLHLSAARAGVAMQPLNQPMEMADRDNQLGRAPLWEQRLEELMGTPGWQPTFSFRAGIAMRAAPASARRDLHDVLAS